MNLFGRKENAAAAPRMEPMIGSMSFENSGDGTSVAGNGSYGAEFYSFLNGGLSRAGMPVNEQTAMTISTVYACVGLIGGALAAMPLHCYKRTGLSRELADHALWPIFNMQPMDFVSAAVFWEYAVWSYMLHGDWFAKIVRPNKFSPEISGLEPLHPMLVEVRREDNRLVYLVQRSGSSEVIDQDDMLHVPNVGFNGLRGMSPIRFALKNPAGIALAADEMSGAYFRNGGKTDTALVAPGKLDKEQVQQMQENWKANQGAVQNSWVPLILSGGVKVEQLQISAEDAQLLSTRKFQVEEICRIFRVPPFMVGQYEKTTSFGSGIEQMGINFVTYTMGSLLVKFQNEINRKCFRSPKYFAEFFTGALMRGDTAARYAAYRVALGRAGEQPWMTTDEVRQQENLPPRDIPVNAPAPGKSSQTENDDESNAASADSKQNGA